MDSNYTTVTIIMATYNRAHFIVETLHSIQNQTFKNFECLIIDDGGTDDTLQVINPILNEDTRFQFLKRSVNYTKGLPGCRNFGLDIAKGEYIIFFDDDDIVHPQNLELCVSELMNSNYDFCRYKRSVFFKDFDYKFDSKVNFEKFEITVNDIRKIINGRLPFNSCAVMWTKNCFDNNRFVESLMYAEEWELYVRLLTENIKGVSIEKTLFYGRKHEQSNTGEFWLGDPIRVQSKKEAIVLILENLVNKKLLTPYLLKYLTSLAISFRDISLLRKLLKTARPSKQRISFIQMKFYLFPIWKFYMRNIKKIKTN